MKWLRNKKNRRLSALAAGMIALFLLWCSPGYLDKVPAKPAEEAVTAWWGTMYPEFCFSRKGDDGAGEASRHKVKISFWLAKTLNWC